MTAFTTAPIQAQPQFDLELFMTAAQETRIEAEIMQRISEYWSKWAPLAHASKITVGDTSYLLAWLDEQVEEDVDSLWEESPSDAYYFNALAQVMCMGMVHDVLPEVEDAGCAPAPAMSEILKNALQEVGVPTATAPGASSLLRRYAVLTYFPYKGSCETCSLHAACPKANAQAGGCSPDKISTVTLPGYDRIGFMK